MTKSDAVEDGKCGCIYATAANTKAVRDGYEMGGYVKEFCPEHAKPDAVEYKDQE